MGNQLVLASPVDAAADDLSACQFPLRFTPFEFYSFVRSGPIFRE